MGEQTVLLSIIAAFVLVSAIALCIQAAFLSGMYKTAKLLEQKVVPLVPKVESLVEATRATVEQSRKQIVDITTKTIEILDSARSQLGKIDDVVSDAANRARVQMDRVEMVLDDTISRVQETVVVLHNGVMRPLRQINGIAVAIRAVLRHFLRGRRPSVAQVTSDEEMFI
jgi:ABC-type transporter Mla subunit MlaD